MSERRGGTAGGVGTLEEPTEVITLKQLGHFTNDKIVNVNGFYDHLIGSSTIW